MNWRRKQRANHSTPTQPRPNVTESDETRDPDAAVLDGIAPAVRPPHNDAPVGRVDDDLGRGPFAELIATQIALSRPASGMVMSLVGPWGAGKSSVLRMVTETLDARAADGERLVVINYNPWFFSGTDQLISGFLLTLADQLPKKLHERMSSATAVRLRRYGAAIGTLRSVPLFGGFFGAASDVSREGAERLKPENVDLLEQRRLVAESLDDLDVHVVVLIDDVDRLQSADEIRQVMQMVKLVGDLPGMTYLLAFDARPVQAALDGPELKGAEFLEKIVQVQHVLPAVSDERLWAMLIRELNAVFGARAARIDSSRWSEIERKIVRPLVRTPRHVRRLTNALSLSVALAGEDVDLTDLVALSAISALLPTFHGALASLFDDLVAGTEASFRIGLGLGKDEAATRLKSAAANSGNEPVALATYELLFPHTSRVLRNGSYSDGTSLDWKRRRRVADLESLYRYLTALTPEDGMSAAETRRIIDATLDDVRFANELASRDREHVAALAARLELHVDEIQPERIPSVARLLSSRGREGADLANGPLGDPVYRIEGVAAGLLAHLPVDARLSALRDWFDEASGISDKLVVFEIGRRTDQRDVPIAGQELLDEQLEVIITILEGLSDAEAREVPEIGRILWLTQEKLLPGQVDHLKSLLRNDWMFARFLLVNTDMNFGRGPRPLNWGPLKAALGSDWLLDRVRKLPDHLDADQEIRAVMATAQQHEREDSDARTSDQPGRAKLD